MPLAWAARWGNAVREAQPCVLFPPSQVAGRASLQATTLKSLGLTGGSAIIRWGPQSPSSGKQGRMAEKMGTSPPDCGPVPLIWDPGPMAAHSPGACAAAAGLGGGGWPGGAGAGSTFGGARGSRAGPGDPGRGARSVWRFTRSLGLHPQVCHEAMQLCWAFTEQSPRKPYRLAVG